MVGFGAWSVKAGMIHVQPPVGVLESMVTIRLHLDDCEEDNGPLRAIPGSHRLGKLSEREVELRVAELDERSYACPRGGVVVMRPLILHASSSAVNPRHRRVLHVEYASCDLPPPLEWAIEWIVQPPQL